MPEKLRILLVDDNEEFCKSVTDILELKDYEVVSAYDGFKALEKVKEDGFGLVLMDVKMTGMDGVQTFKKVREIAPMLPVIMVTAYAVDNLIREALREGAFGSLRKPLDFDKVFELFSIRHSLLLEIISLRRHPVLTSHFRLNFPGLIYFSKLLNIGLLKFLQCLLAFFALRSFNRFVQVLCSWCNPAPVDSPC